MVLHAAHALAGIWKRYSNDMRITSVRAFPISFAVPPEHQVSLGIGRTVKRDAVIVRVDTDEGLRGWGEAHAGRAPTAIAELINTTLATLVTGLDALDAQAVWQRVYRMQLASHGCGAAAVIGLSGIDMALWDIHGKAVGKPLYALLGGERRASEAYAGGITLGFSPPSAVADEAQGYVGAGFRALKLRLGETPVLDCARVRAVRAALPDAIKILTDANTAYSLADVGAVAPTLEDCEVGWLEEPFPAHDYRAYRSAARITRLPLAAGENHYTRFDFERLRDDGAVTVWQPDLSKTGGITEGLRIARLAAAAGIAIHPHTSLTGLNMAASLHLLAVLPNAGYFEADATAYNPFRDELCSPSYAAVPGVVYQPPTEAGLGITINEDFLAASAAITGPGYV